MGEGGHRVVFPMTAEEITAANARLAAIRSTGPLKGKNPVVGFEMAESGHFIEFPEASTEMELGDLVIAGDTADKGATRFQSIIDKNG
jgi:hypothetical protein